MMSCASGWCRWRYVVSRTCVAWPRSLRRLPMAKRRGGRTALRSGAIPRLARALWRAIRWLWRHPQPVFALLFVIGGRAALWRVVTTSDAFQVTDIRVPEDSGLKVSNDLVGQNLWQVDVRRLADELSAQQPAFKRIRVTRRPPHTLEIE